MPVNRGSHELNVWQTEAPGWAGDVPCYRVECPRCGWTSGELYALSDCRQVTCWACNEVEMGRRRRVFIEDAQFVEVVASGVTA